MAFSPSTYLTSQGWSGPGNGLQKGGIKKPVTVAHKTNLKGIGKERDTGYAWWDDVFAMVANKGKNGQAKDLKRTSTGIYSHLAPSTSGTATPVDLDSLSKETTPPTSAAAAFHTDIIGQAKLEATRREFYSKFLRGRTLEGSYDSPSEVEQEKEKKAEAVSLHEKEQEQDSETLVDKAELKRLKKERKEERARRRALKASKEESTATAEPEAGPSDPLLPKQKKEKRKREKTEDNAPPSTPINADVNAFEPKEKRKKRKREKEGAEPMNAQEAGAVQTIETLPPDADAEAARLAKKLRKEERRLRKAQAQGSQ